VTACPAFSANNTFHTVPALPVNATSATVPLACLTLGTPQSCPNTTALLFPLPVTFNEPVSPPCGTNTSVCAPTYALCNAWHLIHPAPALIPCGFSGIPQVLGPRQYWQNAGSHAAAATSLLLA
jgi:hypothetical protein